MKVMTGFQPATIQGETWNEIHHRVIKGYSFEISVPLPDDYRYSFNGIANFRRDIWKWILNYTTEDQVQWRATYEGTFYFYFKQKNIAALFKLSWL